LLNGPHPSALPHNGCPSSFTDDRYPYPNCCIVLRKPEKEPVESSGGGRAAVSEEEEELEKAALRICCCIVSIPTEGPSQRSEGDAGLWREEKVGSRGEDG
jgi:hypothetical protein